MFKVAPLLDQNYILTVFGTLEFIKHFDISCLNVILLIFSQPYDTKQVSITGKASFSIGYEAKSNLKTEALV